MWCPEKQAEVFLEDCDQLCQILILDSLNLGLRIAHWIWLWKSLLILVREVLVEYSRQKADYRKLKRRMKGNSLRSPV